MSETITVHLDEDDVLTYFIVKSTIIGQQIEVDPDRLARWHRVFAEFDEVQWEIRKHVAAARGDAGCQHDWQHLKGEKCPTCRRCGAARGDGEQA